MPPQSKPILECPETIIYGIKFTKGKFNTNEFIYEDNILLISKVMPPKKLNKFTTSKEDLKLVADRPHRLFTMGGSKSFIDPLKLAEQVEKMSLNPLKKSKAVENLSDKTDLKVLRNFETQEFIEIHTKETKGLK